MHWFGHKDTMIVSSIIVIVENDFLLMIITLSVTNLDMASTNLFTSGQVDKIVKFLEIKLLLLLERAPLCRNSTFLQCVE